MKEVVEYILAILIILSVLPFYNMVVSQFYTPEKTVSAGTDISEVFTTIVQKVLADAFNQGNLTLEVSEIKESLEKAVESYAGSLAGEYYYYARVYTPLNITVDPVGRVITVTSLFNATIRILAVSLNGSSSIVVEPVLSKTGGVYMYTYNYTTSPVKSFSAIIAVGEQGAVRFIGYWLNSTEGYTISDSTRRLLVLAPSNITLNTTSFYNFTGVNTTLYYLASSTLANYTSSKTNITWNMKFSGGIPVEVHYNITETRYMADESKQQYNSSLKKYEVYLVKGRTYYRYERGQTWLVESVSSIEDIYAPIYNAVLVSLVSLSDGSKTIQAPVYRNTYILTNAPGSPLPQATRVSSYITIGAFTYMLELWVWRR